MIIVVSYPKSGRTWLRVMLELLGVRFEYTHGGSSLVEGSVELHPPPLPDALLMVRDPLDTVVSAYFQATRRLRVYNDRISEFIRDPRYGIQKINRFHSLWGSRRKTIKYEHLHKDPRCVLVGLLDYAGHSISETAVDCVVKFCSFERMKRVEIAFGNSYGHDTSPEGFKCRRGIVGGWKDYLSTADIAYAKESFKKEPNPFYGIPS